MNSEVADASEEAGVLSLIFFFFKERQKGEKGSENRCGILLTGALRWQRNPKCLC